MKNFILGNKYQIAEKVITAAQPSDKLRAIQARLEVIVDAVLTIRRSVRFPAKLLASLPFDHQERVLSSVEFLTNTSVELAYNFCMCVPPALKTIDAQRRHPWILRHLELYDNGGVIAYKAEIQDLNRYAQSTIREATVVKQRPYARMLEGFVHGHSGRQIWVSPNKPTLIQRHYSYLRNYRCFRIEQATLNCTRP